MIFFFDPIANPQALPLEIKCWKYKVDLNSLLIGRCGEWFYNFNCKKVYEIRIDQLRSDEGIEVIQKLPKSDRSIVLRVVLSLMILPAVIALIDKALFRLACPGLHLNSLPDQWRVAQPGLICGKKRIQSDIYGEAFTPSVAGYQRNSAFIYVSQEHPWFSPAIQIAEITNTHEVISFVTGKWDVKVQKVYIDKYKQYFNLPQDLVTHYLQQERKENLSIAKKRESLSSIPQKIKDHPLYKGEFDDIAHFNEKNCHSEGLFFYSWADASFVLAIGYHRYQLGFKQDHFSISDGRMSMETEDLSEIINLYKPMLSSFHDF